MANVIIPAEHQSSPKQTEIDRALRTAAEEIHSGDFVPVNEFFDTGHTADLAQHPRVIDALRKLETQVQESTSTEYLEIAEKLHILNTESAWKERWPGQERWQGKENIAMRLTNLLTPKQFILKLQAAHISAEMVPHTITENRFDPDGILRPAEVERSDALICLGKYVVRDMCGVFANVKGEYKRIEKLQVPIGPEWGLMRFDEYNVPTNESHHGWRTALLALIRAGVITEAEAHRAFGKPIENDASAFYLEQLAAYRNGAR